MISASLVASKIDERYLAKNFFPIFEGDLKDSMGSRRFRVGRIFGSDTIGAAIGEQLMKLLRICNLSFLDANNVNVLFFVFPNDEFLPFVE